MHNDSMSTRYPKPPQSCATHPHTMVPMKSLDPRLILSVSFLQKQATPVSFFNCYMRTAFKKKKPSIFTGNYIIGFRQQH